MVILDRWLNLLPCCDGGARDYPARELKKYLFRPSFGCYGKQPAHSTKWAREGTSFARCRSRAIMLLFQAFRMYFHHQLLAHDGVA